MSRRLRLLKDNRGVISAMTAVMLAMFVGLLAIVVDLGHLHAVRLECGNAADAGALAGARALHTLYGYPVMAADPPYCELGETTGRDAACQNRSDHILLGQEGVCGATAQRGWWDWSTNTFTERAAPACSLTDPATNVNAIKVTVTRSQSPQGSVVMGFARLLGYQTVDVTASAVAAVGTTEELCTAAPIALCEGYLGKYIGAPGPDDWNLATMRTGAADDAKGDEAFFVNPCEWRNPSAKDMKDWVNGDKQECYSDDCVDPTEGQLESVLKEIKAKVAAMEKANVVNCSQLNPPSQDAWTNCCYQGTKEIGRYTGLLLPVPILKNCKGTGQQMDPDWKAMVVSKVFEPADIHKEPLRSADANSPDPKIRELAAIRDLMEQSQKSVIQATIVDCPVLLPGTSGPGASPLYATFPRLVWTDSNLLK